MWLLTVVMLWPEVSCELLIQHMILCSVFIVVQFDDPNATISTILEEAKKLVSW